MYVRLYVCVRVCVLIYVCMYVYLRMRVLFMHVCTVHICVSALYVLCTYVNLFMCVLHTYVFMYGCVSAYGGDNFKNSDSKIQLKDTHILENFGLITTNSHGCYLNYSFVILNVPFCYLKSL
jgi:hypothetical protein